VAALWVIFLLTGSLILARLCGGFPFSQVFPEGFGQSFFLFLRPRLSFIGQNRFVFRRHEIPSDIVCFCGKLAEPGDQVKQPDNRTFRCKVKKAIFYLAFV